ncbi:MAG: DUF4383 domain-containing protein [Gemmatimonadaceae bacterium]
MPSDKTVRISAVAYSVFFAVVVSLGYIPGLNVQPHVHNPDAMAMPMQSGEHTMLGLYTISLLDDVTHGISAILFLIAGLVSARMSRLALTAFGWYYAYDATIYLITGILQRKPFMQNLGLNAPHVVISGIMLYLAYKGRENVARHEA